MHFTIPLSQGQFATVSVEDYERISAHRWFAHFEKKTGTFYAARNVILPGGIKTLVWMHREVLGLVYKDGKIGDHKDHKDTLNNTRENLRVANSTQSSYNKGCPKSSRTGIKGISLNNGTYLVRITVNRKPIYLGRRRTMEEAHALYAEAAAKYHGEFARLA